MGWGLCMAVVEGLGAEEIAARLEMDLTEDERVLAQLSRQTKVVVVFEINETIDPYAVNSWADGVMAWKVTHSHVDFERFPPPVRPRSRRTRSHPPPESTTRSRLWAWSGRACA
jgi:hypothetical protein